MGTIVVGVPLLGRISTWPTRPAVRSAPPCSGLLRRTYRSGIAAAAICDTRPGNSDARYCIEARDGQISLTHEYRIAVGQADLDDASPRATPKDEYGRSC